MKKILKKCFLLLNAMKRFFAGIHARFQSILSCLIPLRMTEGAPASKTAHEEEILRPKGLRMTKAGFSTLIVMNRFFGRYPSLRMAVSMNIPALRMTRNGSTPLKPYCHPERSEGSLHSISLFRHSTCSFAFTLVETIIAIAIIGIIAAIAIPSVITHYKEQETVSKVKKFYSTFSNAIQLAIADNGSVDTWDLSTEDDENDYDETSANKLAEYIKPYLKIYKDCGTETDSECMASDVLYKFLNGTSFGSDRDYANNTGIYKIILTDGSLIWFRTESTCHETTKAGQNSYVCAVVYFDINGSEKEPNTLGKDMFHLHIKPDGVHVPDISSPNDCKLNNDGWDCGSLILQYSDMNYLSE